MDGLNLTTTWLCWEQPQPDTQLLVMVARHRQRARQILAELARLGQPPRVAMHALTGGKVRLVLWPASCARSAELFSTMIYERPLARKARAVILPPDTAWLTPAALNGLALQPQARAA